ncbi:hypothetical protein ACQ4PT_017665 [Festuca glaucescens]
MGLDAFAAVCCAIPVLLSLLVVRVAYVLCRSGLPPSKPHAAELRCLIVLGSGGHTAEMMNILTELQKDRFTPRYYVAALTDNMSLQKAQVYEKSLIQIFCNGPGTCIPLCASAFILKVLGLGWSSIFYIEEEKENKNKKRRGEGNKNSSDPTPAPALAIHRHSDSSAPPFHYSSGQAESGIPHRAQRKRATRREAGGDELLRCMDGASEEPLHKDYYKVLEVDYGASDDTIKLSYRRLALKWHPDKHKGEDDVTAKFQEINEAYKILSDPITRLEYDFSGGYEINQYTAREYLSRFKGMILTCNGLGIDHSSKWAQHMREWEPH